MAKIKVLGAIRFEAITKYREMLIKEDDFDVKWVPGIEQLNNHMTDKENRTDVLVIDNTLGDVHSLIEELRQQYPSLLIILVDEDADFALPGRADEISTQPFKDNELVKLVKRVYEDRRLVTMRADALPPVREFAKKIMKAQRGPAKIQAAVDAIYELGVDYVAFFSVTMSTDPPLVSVVAQAGDEKTMRIAPQKQDYNDSLIGTVAQDGKTRIVRKDDEPNHPFVSRGKYGLGVAVPVGTTIRFGVFLACQESSDINEQRLMMLELVSAQLASAMAREARS
ncbi:MAG: hypothetical protein L0154_15790 [Chloroflexi bacterium]|nr:hypothetical protein [Chloroflexota bacterium]